MSARAATKLARVEGLPPDEILFGSSPAMEEVRQKALKICKTNVAVLLLGEGGTGKETLARWLHANSDYSSGEFVSELRRDSFMPARERVFGHEKGALPEPMRRSREGVERPTSVPSFGRNRRPRLRPAKQAPATPAGWFFSRLGDQVERAVDTRIVCATGRKLEEEIEVGISTGSFAGSTY
jgi:DNA-binding NtrC family response regulator